MSPWRQELLMEPERDATGGGHGTFPPQRMEDGLLPSSGAVWEEP